MGCPRSLLRGKRPVSIISMFLLTSMDIYFRRCGFQQVQRIPDILHFGRDPGLRADVPKISDLGAESLSERLALSRTRARTKSSAIVCISKSLPLPTKSKPVRKFWGALESLLGRGMLLRKREFRLENIDFQLGFIDFRLFSWIPSLWNHSSER